LLLLFLQGKLFCKAVLTIFFNGACFWVVKHGGGAGGVENA
jgi:hypothetical protein